MTVGPGGPNMDISFVSYTNIRFVLVSTSCVCFYTQSVYNKCSIYIPWKLSLILLVARKIILYSFVYCICDVQQLEQETPENGANIHSKNQGQPGGWFPTSVPVFSKSDYFAEMYPWILANSALSVLPTALLKAEQASIFKFPLGHLSCPGLGSPISSALLAASSGLQGGSGSAHHLPLELHLRGKLESGVSEQGSKAKKGRRSRTVFTELQLMGLEKRFEKQKYLSTPDR